MKELSIFELLKIIFRYWKFVIACVIAWTALAAVIIFFVITPQYSSSTQILVNESREGEIIRGSDIETNLRLINTYKDIIKSPVILDEVRAELNTDLTHEQLSEKIKMSNQDNSQVFILEVTDESHSKAASIANTISETFENKIGEIMSIENVTIISSAVAKPVPVFPNKVLSILISMVLGLANGIGLAFLLYSLDNTIKEESFINERLGWISLGQIEELPYKEFNHLDSRQRVEEPSNPSALRTRL
ncbi:YveK family protein [Alkalibacterium sp. f15]|uniref:YveK family protein n=1 Tax=Alkalibacterium sp. f15 TaxID=3414029 RepID=UPI003BF87289